MDLPIIKSSVPAKAEAEERKLRDEHGHNALEHKVYKGGAMEGGKVLTIETNWNKEVDKNQYLRISIGKESVVVDNHEVRDIIKLIAPFREMEGMMAGVKKFYEMTRVVMKTRASKRYERGDEIVSIVEIPVRPA